MIVCVLDDLIFSIKIRTAARSLGADVYFERSPDNVVPIVREKRPALVIVDLNSARMRPIETIAALKRDPELKAIPVLGYVAHVDTATITAAREAGIDHVLARSAFTERLGEILTAGRA